MQIKITGSPILMDFRSNSRTYKTIYFKSLWWKVAVGMVSVKNAETKGRDGVDDIEGGMCSFWC